MTVLNNRNKRHLVRKAPFIAIAFFLLLWFGGITAGEPVRVLEQAVRVCLSCIGLG